MRGGGCANLVPGPPGWENLGPSPCFLEEGDVPWPGTSLPSSGAGPSPEQRISTPGRGVGWRGAGVLLRNEAFLLSSPLLGVKIVSPRTQSHGPGLLMPLEPCHEFGVELPRLLFLAFACQVLHLGALCIDEDEAQLLQPQALTQHLSAGHHLLVLGIWSGLLGRYHWVSWESEGWACGARWPLLGLLVELFLVRAADPSGQTPHYSRTFTSDSWRGRWARTRTAVMLLRMMWCSVRCSVG